MVSRILLVVAPFESAVAIMKVEPTNMRVAVAIRKARLFTVTSQWRCF
jgi:hypothetical protein